MATFRLNTLGIDVELPRGTRYTEVAVPEDKLISMIMWNLLSKKTKRKLFPWMKNFKFPPVSFQLEFLVEGIVFQQDRIFGLGRDIFMLYETNSGIIGTAYIKGHKTITCSSETL